MDHTNHVHLDDNELTAAVLNGATIYGPDDEKVGTIAEIYSTGTDTKVIVDVGGFLGIGAKPVQVWAKDLNLMRDENGEVHGHTRWTKDQLKDMPEFIPPEVL